MLNKAALLVVGFLVAGSTVYALVLRTAPETTHTDQAEIKVHGTLQPAGLAAVVPRPAPRVWGRLVMLERPEELGQVAATITTPPLVIQAGEEPGAQPAPRAVQPKKVANGAGPTGQLPPSPSGVMARFKAVPKPVENLPEAPSRNEIAQVMDSIRGKVQDCYDTGMVPGQVDLTLTVAGENGSVRNAGISATSSTATCIRRIARGLKFPRFSREQVTIRYPYSFR